MYRKTIILCCAFLLLGCSSDTAIIGISGPDTTPSASPTSVTEKIELPLTRMQKPGGLKIVQSYTMPKAAGGITSGFGFENGILWSRGSSDDKANELMFSADFGLHWQFIKAPRSDRENDSDGLGADGGFDFTDSENGWAFDSSTVIHTTDGGKSWRLQDDLLKRFDLTSIQAIHFIDKDIGFLGASASRVIEKGLGTSYFAVVVLCTTNGGDTWQVCKKVESLNDIQSIASSSGRTAILADGAILFTDDLGKNWKRVDLHEYVTDLASDPSGKFWITQEDGRLRSSTDFVSWVDTLIDQAQSSKKLLTIAFSDTGSGFGLVGGGDGFLAMTEDLGKTWKMVDQDRIKGNIWKIRINESKVAILEGGRTIWVAEPK